MQYLVVGSKSLCSVMQLPRRNLPETNTLAYLRLRRRRRKQSFFPHRHLIPLLPQVVVVVRLHVLLEVPDVGEAAVADGTRVVQVLAQRCRH